MSTTTTATAGHSHDRARGWRRADDSGASTLASLAGANRAVGDVRSVDCSRESTIVAQLRGHAHFCYDASVARPSPGWPQGVMDSAVLLLNSDYEPLNVCNVRRAFRLVFAEKAEVIQYDHHDIRTATASSARRASSAFSTASSARGRASGCRGARSLPATSTPASTAARQTHDLTLDHVVPRHRGGGHTWDNLVAACKTCNHRKGGSSLDEARMRLMRPPFEPRCDVYTLFTPYLSDPRNEAWRDYLFVGHN